MSFYDWSLLTQAHQRTQYREDQRALLILNAWSEDNITLEDLHGGTRQGMSPKRDGTLKRRVMKEKGISKDLTTNRL